MSKKIPEVQESTKFNFVLSIWIVPLIALLIALWLAFQYYSELGPKIEIIFKSNEGLKAGQSQIKYKDVPIGKIEKVVLRSDGDGIKVIARMDKEAIPYLNEDAKFWIVKPEVGIGGVSGLETIISGTYIKLYSKKGEMKKKKFIGLQKPYRLLEDGEYFHLNASSAFNVKKGTPIFFKNMQVGYAEYVTISLDGKSVDVIVYIEKSYIPYIHTDTKFWIQSTVDIDYANGQFDFNIAPLAHIVRGGIEFSSSGEDITKKVPYNHIFRLYKNSSVAADKQIGKGGKAVREYLMHFNESIAKLNIDASVRYDNFDIGSVKDISLSYNRGSHQMTGKVIASIDTSIFFDPSDRNHTGEENLEQAVREGLRASVQEYDPISGLLYIDLSFTDENRSREIVSGERYTLFPTVTGQGAGIMSGLTGIVDAIQKLPLDELVDSMDKAVSGFTGLLEENKETTRQLLLDLDETLDGINKLVGNKEFARIPTELNKTMRALQKSLKSLDSVMQGNSNQSLLSSQLTETLKEVAKASRDTQKMMRKLDRKPNSLIFGD
ncbi:MAG: MlaD family protein [Campylobacterota bacterium]|nr:MlaD family protein [Campylobacterota bacterium]